MINKGQFWVKFIFCLNQIDNLAIDNVEGNKMFYFGLVKSDMPIKWPCKISNRHKDFKPGVAVWVRAEYICIFMSVRINEIT